MQYIEYVDVDESFLRDIWDKVSLSPGYYSIGDGFSYDHLRHVFFNSDIVARLEGGFARVEVKDNFIEIHVLVFGPSFFRNAKSALKELSENNKQLFQDKDIRCIIPSRMKGFRRLAKYAGMVFQSQCIRFLSGSPITCDVFSWRPDNV
jgi:hypothetical protein